jgi:hypothetical protein
MSYYTLQEKSHQLITLFDYSKDYETVNFDDIISAVEKFSSDVTT